MLFVSFFTFFGLSAIQSLSCFIVDFNSPYTVINLTGEEESETSNNEVKEAVSDLSNRSDFSVHDYENQLAQKFRHFLSYKCKQVFEISTPPPE